MQEKELIVEVICTDLPGARFCDQDSTVREPVYLGIQKGDEVIEMARADRKQVVFRPAFRMARQADGSPNFLGPFAHGTPRERFFYLSWGVVRPGQPFAMFRRAKIHLNHIQWPHVEAALSKNKPITVQLKLTDSKGGPRCASVRVEHADWRL